MTAAGDQREHDVLDIDTDFLERLVNTRELHIHLHLALAYGLVLVSQEKNNRNQGIQSHEYREHSRRPLERTARVDHMDYPLKQHTADNDELVLHNDRKRADTPVKTLSYFLFQLNHRALIWDEREFVLVGGHLNNALLAFTF